MWDEAIPYLYWEVGVHDAKASDEVVLVSFYGFSAALRWFVPGGTNWYAISFLEILFLSAVEASLSRICNFGFNPCSVRWSTILVYAPTTSESLKILIGFDNIEFLS